MSDQPVVRRACISDVVYIDSLRRRESEALGFLPTVRYEAAATGEGIYSRPGDRLWIAEASGDRVGYLLLTSGCLGGAAKIIQVAVQMDARRHEYASALVLEAERHAIEQLRTGVSLAVAEDLEAAQFWDALGYELRARYAGGSRRGRVLERRWKPLPVGLWSNENGNAASLGLTA